MSSKVDEKVTEEKCIGGHGVPACLGVLSVSLCCRLGTFLQALSSAWSQDCSHWLFLYQEDLLAPKNRDRLGQNRPSSCWPSQQVHLYLCRHPQHLCNPVFSNRHTYIFVIDTFHEHQLPVSPLSVGLVLEGSAQLLDGYISVQDSVIAGAAGGKQQCFG